MCEKFFIILNSHSLKFFKFKHLIGINTLTRHKTARASLYVNLKLNILVRRNVISLGTFVRFIIFPPLYLNYDKIVSRLQKRVTLFKIFILTNTLVCVKNIWILICDILHWWFFRCIKFNFQNFMNFNDFCEH